MPSPLSVPTQLRCNLISVYRDTVNLHVANRSRHLDTCFATWWVFEGKVRLVGKWGDVELGPGSRVFLAPHLERSQFFERGTRILSVRFQCEEPALFSFEDPGFHYFSSPPSAGFEATSHALLGFWNALNNKEGTLPQKDPLTAMKLHGGFISWLAEWYNVCTPFLCPTRFSGLGENRIAAMLSILNQQISLMPDYPALCKIADISRSQVDRIFKKHGLGSPHQVCERNTLQRAEKLLLTSYLSIKAIASDLGFYDASHFTRWFKQQTSVSPRQFRVKPLW